MSIKFDSFSHYNTSPRYGFGKPPHPILYKIINRNRDKYSDTLERFLEFKKDLSKIPSRITEKIQEPQWINPMIPGLDSAALYSFLCLNDSKRYYEVGSGYSTRFARRAILDQGLSTRITSIDPNPLIDIDSICDNNIRKPLEDVDLNIFDKLEAGDVLFIDGTHRCFTNSDVTVVFLDILPQLRKGVLIQFHDIILPYDYPPQWNTHYYSEQYLLATYLLAEGNKFDIILPNTFISTDSELEHALDPLWDNPKLREVDRKGCSFWMVAVAGQPKMKRLKDENYISNEDYCNKCGGTCPSNLVCKPLSRDHPIFKRRKENG